MVFDPKYILSVIAGLEKKMIFKKCRIRSLKLALKADQSLTFCGEGSALCALPERPASLAGMCLGELVINPHQQHMDAFYWVIDWEGMISVSSLVGLLEKHFFPKWLQVHLFCFILLGVGWMQGGFLLGSDYRCLILRQLSDSAIITPQIELHARVGMDSAVTAPTTD